MDGQLRVYIGADTANFKRQIKGAQNSLNQFKKVSIDAGAAIRKTFINAFAVTSAYDFFNNLITTGKNFENQMARVTAVCNATTQQYKLMRTEAERLGATTTYTASEAAQALENLTRNGLDARRATKALSGVLELAGANAIDLAEAADIATNTMNMFRLEVEDLNRVNDVLSATCANSATNITDLYEAMKYAGSTANLFGFSIEETSAALGVLANMGIKGSQAGTALRSMFLRLASPTAEAAKVLEKYGLEINETTMKADGLEKTLKKLYDSGIGNSVADSSELFGKLFGGTNVALINSYDSFQSMANVTRASEGTAARMFKQGIGEFKEAADTFSSNLESAMIQLFNNIKPIGVWLLNTMNDVVSMAKSTGWWLMNGAIIGLGKATQHTTRMSKEADLIQKYSKMANDAFNNAKKIKPTKGWDMNTVDIDTLRNIKDIYQEISQEALKAGITMTDINDVVVKARAAISAGGSKNQSAFVSNLDELLVIQDQIRLAANDGKKAFDGLWNTIKTGAKSCGNALVNFLGGWWNIAIGGILLVGNSIYNSWRKSTAAIDEYNQIQKDLSSNNARLEVSLRKSVESLRGMNKESGAWKATVAYIKQEYPELIDKIDLEAIHVNTSAEAWAKYSKELGEAIEKQKQFNQAESAQKSIDVLSEDLFNKTLGKTFKNLNKNASEVDKITKLSPAEQEIKELIKSGNVTLKAVEDVFKQYNIPLANGKLSGAPIASIQNSETYREIKELAKLIKPVEANKFTRADLNKDLELFKERFEANKAAIEEEGRVAGKDQATIDSEIKNLADRFVNEIINKYKNVEIDGQKGLDLVNANASFQNIRFASSTNTSVTEGGTDYVEGSISAIKAEIAALESQLSNWDLAGKIDLQREIFKQIEALKKELEALEQEQYEIHFKVKYPEAPTGQIPASPSFASLAEVKSPKIDKIEMPDFGKQTEKVEKNANSYVSALNAMADATRAFASSQFEDTGEGWTMWSANVLASIGATIPAIMALCQAEGVKSAFKLPFPANLAAAATVMAAVVAMFASIPTFSTGGIFGGNSTVGDMNLARVNAGEMILNNRQQRNLFNLLNGNGNISSGGGQVEFKIRGKELVGVLNNYNNQKSKVL